MDSFTYKVLHERDKLAALLRNLIYQISAGGEVQAACEEAVDYLDNVTLLELEPQTSQVTAGQSQPNQQPSEGLRLDHSGLRLQKPPQ